MSRDRWLPADRVGVLNAFGTWLVLILVARASVPWTVVPPLLWGALVAVAALHLIVAADRTARLPVVLPGARRLPRVAGALAWPAFAVALLAASIR